ncbi:hypothetical protein GCM10025868_00720 [Angustibacter aerolatus]|uniref:Peptidase M20 dimerisation domain-containing protein n=1 Tax=Angustibacter aerolatus TaxID=1162965 RepID=A0ABQ6J9H5_9ACTN|nr:M20/M25/M40 family metallo-hydrolase [Angustibacter aerolatus]GMA84822.1 hypothetical protein GCM10025868_00720 [Angustibacter aerolatus]
MVRVEGDEAGTRERGALIVHGHLDVVPADASDWQVDPFAGEQRDGCLWGRGAVDMKDMDAMMLAVLRDLARSGRKPPRDLVFAFFADEEAGGVLGSHYAVDHRREPVRRRHRGDQRGRRLLRDARGPERRPGARLPAADRREGHRLAAAARPRPGRARVADHHRQRGRQGLGAAVARIGQHEFPVEITPTVREFLEGVTEITGVELDPSDPQPLLDRLGTVARFVGATFRDTANPTMLKAGYKHNVVPQARRGVRRHAVPARPRGAGSWRRSASLAGEGVDVEVHHRDIALETTFDGSLVDAMVAAIQAEDPGAPVLPYCLSGGTDNKALSEIGIRGFGFAPLQPARRPRLPGDVPRGRRAGAGRRAGLRRAGARPAAAHLLSGRAAGRRQAVRCTRMIRRRNQTWRAPPA